MSATATKRMLKVYRQMAAPTLFLSGLFRSPPENFHNSESVEIDIVRSEEDIAIVIQDLSLGYRNNSKDIYTNKEFIPPVFKEKITLNSSDLLKRMPGESPFKNPVFRGNLIKRMFDSMQGIERKIRRVIELQASQVLQTGIITLSNAAGTALYTLDYKPKSSHFITAAISWATATAAQKIANVQTLLDVVRKDGLTDVDQLLFGETVFENFFNDPVIQKRFDLRRFDQGTLGPRKMRGSGGQFRGTVEIGNYKMEVWTYSGRYKHPQSGVSTAFLDPGKIIAMASGSRLDATFGGIPNIGRLLGAQANNLVPELPRRLRNSVGGMDLHTNIWVTPDGEQLMGGVGSRPLLIPTAIDTFACLTTQL